MFVCLLAVANKQIFKFVVSFSGSVLFLSDFKLFIFPGRTEQTKCSRSNSHSLLQEILSFFSKWLSYPCRKMTASFFLPFSQLFCFCLVGDQCKIIPEIRVQAGFLKTWLQKIIQFLPGWSERILFRKFFLLPKA